MPGIETKEIRLSQRQKKHWFWEKYIAFDGSTKRRKKWGYGPRPPKQRVFESRSSGPVTFVAKTAEGMERAEERAAAREEKKG